MQTYQDDKIINNMLDSGRAYWVPYSNNDKIFYHQNREKIIDVGMYFKVQRHAIKISGNVNFQISIGEMIMQPRLQNVRY